MTNFGQPRGCRRAGADLKNYYVPKSVCIAIGILIDARQHAGLAARYIPTAR